MKRIIAIIASLALTAAAALSFAGPASATNESTTFDLKMKPIKGGLTKSTPKPVNWSVESKISTPDATIDPLKELNLQMPKDLSFNASKSMPVCPDSKIGPGKVSIEAPDAVKACPDSIIGQGLATFALAQQTSLPRDGVMIAFYGGMKNGLPLVKIYAYSYDTGVGLYTETVLQKNGKMQFKIPQLTADSSVTSLNLAIPGKETSLYVASKDITVKLPKGQDNNFAQATCSTGKWPFSAQFLLGDRDTLNNPTGPTIEKNNSGSASCKAGKDTGSFKVKAKGPASVKKGKKGTYKVTVKNTTGGTISGVKVKASGKGASGKASGGSIKAGKSKTIKVKVKFSKKGKIKTKFKATGKGASASTATKTVKVK